MDDQSGSQNNVTGDQNDQSGSQNQSNSAEQQSGEQPEVKKIQTKFQSTSLRDYFEQTNMTAILTRGLEELGRARPQNPVRFLGQFLLENDPEK